MITNSSAQVKSRFGYHYEYNGLIILGCFILLGIAKLLFSTNPFTDEDREMALLGGLILIPGFLYILYRIIRVPSIIITDQSISLRAFFKTTVIPWSEIVSISLTGKHDRGFLMEREEGTELKLKNKRRIVLWTAFYSNQHEIRSLLDKVNISLSQGTSISIYEMISTDPEYFFTKGDDTGYIKFAGNPHTTWRGLIYYGFIIGMICIAISDNRGISPIALIFLIPIVIFYIGFGKGFYYFYLSGQVLIVRNHYFFWIKKRYDISQIREIVIETPNKSPKSMRIITKEFKDRLYGAASLRPKHWTALRMKIDELKIPLRIELY